MARRVGSHQSLFLLPQIEGKIIKTRPIRGTTGPKTTTSGLEQDVSTPSSIDDRRSTPRMGDTSPTLPEQDHKCDRTHSSQARGPPIHNQRPGAIVPATDHLLSNNRQEDYDYSISNPRSQQSNFRRPTRHFCTKINPQVGAC